MLAFSPIVLGRMRFQFMLIPAALVVAAAPSAVGMTLQSLETASAQLFPDAQLTPVDLELTFGQVQRLKKEFEVPVMHSEVRAWKASTGGWLYLDQVVGMNDVVTYLVAIDEVGRVIGTEVLVCLEGFCNIADAEWSEQFIGQKFNDPDPRKDIIQISGSTLSVQHITEGIVKVLAIHKLFMPK